jgi:hypothetical protein
MKQSDRNELQKLIQDLDNVEKMIVYFEHLEKVQQGTTDETSSAGKEQHDSDNAEFLRVLLFGF